MHHLLCLICPISFQLDENILIVKILECYLKRRNEILVLPVITQSLSMYEKKKRFGIFVSQVKSSNLVIELEHKRILAPNS